MQSEQQQYNEEDGVKAIIFLQGLSGITETEEQARSGWKEMSDDEKASTMAAYEALKEDDGGKETKEKEEQKAKSLSYQTMIDRLLKVRADIEGGEKSCYAGLLRKDHVDLCVIQAIYKERQYRNMLGWDPEVKQETRIEIIDAVISTLKKEAAGKAKCGCTHHAEDGIPCEHDLALYPGAEVVQVVIGADENIQAFVSRFTVRGECKCGRCVDVGSAPDPEGEHTINMVFFKVGLNGKPSAEDFIALSKIHKGVFGDVDVFDGKEHGFVELGGWLGSQGLAINYMALGVMLGVFDLFSPFTVMGADVPQDLANQLAQSGFLTVKLKGQEDDPAIAQIRSLFAKKKKL